MENVTESASSSALAWRWTIEALACFEEVKPSLLHDVIDKASELFDGTRKNAGEMVALKCLEGLFGPLNDIGENGPPAQESKVMFDSSESCENVVKRIYKETPESALRVAGPDMLKWDVKPFIDQKNASMRCTLHQLKDSILDGTHPYADFLIQKSGLTPINKRDNISLNNEDHIKLSRRLDDSSSSPQGKKEEGKGSPLLDDEIRISLVNPSSSSLLPSKRSAVDFTSEDEARQLPGCDDGFINVKKLKHHSARTLYSGQEVASSHGTELVEDSSERSGPQIERDDTNHLDGHQITLVGDKLVEEEHFGSKKSGQCTATDELHESDIPYTVLASTQDGEMLEVVSTEKVGDGKELPFEPKASNHSPAEGPNNSKCDSGHDYHVNEMITVSHSGFLSTTVATNIDVGMNPDEKEKDILSDSDGYHETIDIAMRKKEFLSSQCMVDRDSFLLADRREITVCVKCNEGGQLLSCNISDCPLVVHAKCLGSSARMNDEGNFCCPFCLYSLAISKYLEAKKHAALAKKNVAAFLSCFALERQSIDIEEVLQQKDLDPSRRAGVEDVAKISEDVDLENKENEVTLDGEHVNEDVDRQSITDTERIIELSKPMHTANSNHRENESSLLRVAPDVLSGEKDDNELVDRECPGNTAAELVDQECHGNTVAELVDQECQGKENTVAGLVDPECQGKDNTVAELVDQECQGKDNTVAELVDQECQGNVAELKDGQKATEQHEIYKILHKDRGPIEPADMEDDLQYQTDDNEDEAACAIITEGEKSSDDGNDDSIISRYSIRFRQKYHHTSSETHPSRRKKLPWTAEEEEAVLEGVRKFSSSVDRSPTIPWKKILEFGSSVFRS
ncbi:uncharacterized protein LOC120090944 [Benincasa hispida]|uniref:uncharacterized protein LOC120090944 n=1 Tax=Benincasa hispida TaxID=102211 RepID=UPI0018FF7999|nr:uncharacterized protein LOC120090944 [Benincasa hispida]XP_038904580.1 uncharacterized protein LOC120090944 [Benincasa hispida]XP_038904581.1 uncharacterized protein LOC120090944 [Benincasa hispida]XP_038904582.1 uncharacterized protein LOC120090944 [Benincasa hispida]